MNTENNEEKWREELERLNGEQVHHYAKRHTGELIRSKSIDGSYEFVDIICKTEGYTRISSRTIDVEDDK